MESLKKLAKYCNVSCNLLWLGTFEELKICLCEILQEPNEEVEVVEDTKHNSRSLKLRDLTVRYYSTTTLKLFGEKAKTIRDVFYKELGIFTQDEDEDLSSPLQSSSCSIIPNQQQHSNCVSLEFFKAEITKVREEIYHLKSDLCSDQSIKSKNNCETEAVQVAKETICKLNIEATALKEEVRRLSESLRKSESEKQSLLTTLDIIMSKKGVKAGPILQSDDGNTTTPKTTAVNGSGSNDEENPTKNGQHKKSVTKEKSKKNSKSGNVKDTEEVQAGAAAAVKPTRTVIIGDSIISGLKGWRMSDKTNKITVRSIAGSKLEGMTHYIIPTLEQKPDNIVVHIGTNNLYHNSPQEISEKMIKLCETIKKDCPQANIGLSELTPRRDSKELEGKRKQVNEAVRLLSQSKPWTVISHPTLDEHSFNTRGVHLNGKGSALLAKDFKNFVYSTK